MGALRQLPHLPHSKSGIDEPTICQLAHGARARKIHFGNEEVEGQGHMRPK